MLSRLLALSLTAASLSSAADFIRPPTSDIVLTPTGPISTPQAARDAARPRAKPARSNV